MIAKQSLKYRRPTFKFLYPKSDHTEENWKERDPPQHIQQAGGSAIHWKMGYQHQHP